MARLFILTFLLICVLLVGLGIGPLGPLSSSIQQQLEPWGIDVSMTPITADMTMMRDTTDSLSLYQTSPKIVIINKDSSLLPISPRELELYQFKLPLILYLELYAYNFSVPETLWALCYNLSKRSSSISGFIIEIDHQSDFLKQQGFNVFHECI